MFNPGNGSGGRLSQLSVGTFFAAEEGTANVYKPSATESRVENARLMVANVRAVVVSIPYMPERLSNTDACQGPMPPFDGIAIANEPKTKVISTHRNPFSAMMDAVGG